MDINSVKRWRTEEKVPTLREPELFSEIPVPSSNPRTFRKYKQFCIARQCAITRRFHRTTSETERDSLVNHGLIPGGVSLTAGRHAVFFTVVNSMDNQDGSGGTLCDLPQGRIAPYKNTWKHFQNTVFWCILKVAQQRGLQFYQTRSNAVIVYDTLPAEFIEKAICIKTKDQLYQRESVIVRPRVVLRPNSQSGSQDLLVQEARSSWESQQDAESYGETRSNTADHRVPGISISTVELQDARRQNNVKKLIEMFEKHHLKDTSQKQEIIRFSEESQQLLEDMNQTEIFDFFVNSAKLHCLDCNALSEIGIICCSCRRNLKYKRSPTKLPRRLIATFFQSLA